MADPGPGQMYLYDDVTLPLVSNSYRITASTAVTVQPDTPNAAAQDLPSVSNYFDIGSPRFQLATTEVAGVFPPRNGHGDFSLTIPHIALYRRTLPWERALDPGGNIKGKPSPTALNLPPPYGPPPWLALLLFEDKECTVLSRQPLESVVPPDVLQRLIGHTAPPPSGITCDAIQTTRGLLEQILPSLEELTLLCHVRQVSVEDRELSAGSSDGWFSVVMSNRLPNPGAKCRACLVSLEERSDLVQADPPGAGVGSPPDGTVQLVLLYSWTFEAAGTATFSELMQGLDVAMLGTVANPGHPPVADTGHIQLEVFDRLGAQETVWYRGPLVPYPLSRDALGPYHSADQARRVTPETGAEDVSYAAAFEVGRLLAAADPRLAQDLMRWRREAYKISAVTATVDAVSKILPGALALDPRGPVAPIIALRATAQAVAGRGQLADVYGLHVASQVIGMNPQYLKQALGLSSAQEAITLLGGGGASALGSSVTTGAQTPRTNTTLSTAAADTASLQTLSTARDRTIANTFSKLGGVP